jgi:hypothetical protein
MKISSFSYNNVCGLFVELKVIYRFFYDKYNWEIYFTNKKKKKIIKEEIFEWGAIVIFNTTGFYFYEGTSLECNKLKKLFKEENKQNKLFDSFNFLNSLQSISLIQKNILDFISISIYFLFNKEK